MQWHPTPVLLPGKSHGRRSLVGCSPWGREESDTTERLHFDFSLSYYWRRKWQPTPVFLPRESQGQGSLVGCRLWGRKSRTRLKRLSSSSRLILEIFKCTGFIWQCCPPDLPSLLPPLPPPFFSRNRKKLLTKIVFINPSYRASKSYFLV